MDAILTFHSLDDSGSVLSYPPLAFARALDAIHQAGVEVVRIDDLLLPAVSPARSHRVALTFDDAYESIHRVALPELHRRGLPAIVYVVADFVGGTNRWPTQPSGVPEKRLLGETELKEWISTGQDLGAHGTTHRPLLRLSTSELDHELAGAKRSLEDRFGRTVVHLAYPYGIAPAATRQHAAKIYRSAVTTTLAYLRPPIDPAALPRLDSYYLQDPSRVGRMFEARLRTELALRRPLRWLRSLFGSSL